VVDTGPGHRTAPWLQRDVRMIGLMLAQVLTWRVSAVEGQGNGLSFVTAG
jgi:hypothetical protein